MGALRKSTSKRLLDGDAANDIMRAIAAAESIALFDLKLPNRSEWLHAERPALENRGFQIVDLPNGEDLEETWENAPKQRLQLQEIRTNLASAVDGEVFFRAARRAIWLAQQTQPKRIYAPGIAEALTVWLAAKLMEPAPELFLAFDAQPGWQTALLRRLAEDAAKVSDGTGKLDSEDALLHGAIPHKRRQLGPIKWKTRRTPPNADERANLITNWI